MIRSFVITCFIVFSCGCLLFTSCKRNEKYTGPPEERQLRWAEDAYVSSYVKDKKMELIVLGDFTETKKRVYFGAWLRAYYPMSLEQGRILAAEFVQDYWNTFKNHPLTKQYVEKRLSKRGIHEMELQHFAVKIAYWDQQVNRPPIPYLADITFCDKTFNYYQADPETQALRLIYRESYEEAIDNLKKNAHRTLAE
jgi:hypothetical protein